MNWEPSQIEVKPRRSAPISFARVSTPKLIEIQPVEYELSPRAKQVMENAQISLDASGQPIVTYHSNCR